MIWPDYYEEGAYCGDCDMSYPEEKLEILSVDQWSDIYVCPHGHVFPGTFLSESYYCLGLYLLSIADEEWALPEYVRPLPMYDGDITA